MNILVTGGAGFIGSHLMERLLAGKHKVVCLDDFNDYYSPEIKKDNLKSVKKTGAVKVYKADIRDLVKCRRIFAAENPEVVVHLAARAGVRPSLQDPLLYEDVNCHGTLNMLELSRKCGVKKFIFGSSSSVYGNSGSIPFNEDDTDIKQVSPYGTTKRIGELYCYNYHKLYDMPIVCLRFFTVYGPRQRPDMAIHKFTRLISEGKPVPMFGDGTTKRDYTYYTDIINGITASIEAGMGYEIINLGESRTVELRYLIELIGKNLGRRVRIAKFPAQPGDVDLTCADIGKARRLLGYKPQVPIERGIEEFVGWYMRRMNNEK